MTLLATQLSSRLGLGLVTDSASADQLASAVRKGQPLAQGARRRSGRHYEAYGPRHTMPTNVAPGLLVDVMLQGIRLPDHLPARDLIRFKRDHQDELATLRTQLQRLAAELPPELPVQALRQVVQDQYHDQVVPALNSQRRSLTAQGWDAALGGFLKVTFLSAAPTSLGIMLGVPAPVALLAGAGVSVAATAVMISNQLDKIRGENPYTYILSLEREW